MGQKLNSIVSWKQQLSEDVGGGYMKESNSVGGGVEKSAVCPPTMFCSGTALTQLKTQLLLFHLRILRLAII